MMLSIMEQDQKHLQLPILDQKPRPLTRDQKLQHELQ